MKIKRIIFDWGDTIMRDFKHAGPMKNWDYVEMIPGAAEMLESISPFYTCCIATSADHSGTEEMIEALARVGIVKFFNHFFSSADLGVSKPDPAFFKAIVKKLGTDPGNCLAVGNLYHKDIVPAKKAGLNTVFFNEFDVPGSYPEADYVIKRIDELTRILKKHEKT
ncbi:MAG TPA: HAD family hydrolase [Bacteroidales bacterium]|nr:HAD family hydrolase [Bacteroidales bacterium]